MTINIRSHTKQPLIVLHKLSSGSSICISDTNVAGVIPKVHGKCTNLKLDCYLSKTKVLYVYLCLYTAHIRYIKRYITAFDSIT